MTYVLTVIFWNEDQTDYRCEKRFTDDEHLEICIDTAKRDAKRHTRTLGGKAEIHQNKCYMCFNGYLFTGDYICQIQ